FGLDQVELRGRRNTRRHRACHRESPHRMLSAKGTKKVQTETEKSYSSTGTLAVVPVTLLDCFKVRGNEAAGGYVRSVERISSVPLLGACVNHRGSRSRFGRTTQFI